MTENEITTDIYLVAAYIVLGAELLLPLDTSDPKHIKFKLRDKDNKIPMSDIKQYWVMGEVEGSLTSYAKAIRDLKMLVHL